MNIMPSSFATASAAVEEYNRQHKIRILSALSGEALTLAAAVDDSSDTSGCHQRGLMSGEAQR
jgi:hypothetical protein